MPYVSDEQICVNEARDKVVPCDSPEARYNLALPGSVVSDEDAKKYGLKLQKAEEEPAPVVEPEPVVEEKAVEAAPSNKAKMGAASK